MDDKTYERNNQTIKEVIQEALCDIKSVELDRESINLETGECLVKIKVGELTRKMWNGYQPSQEELRNWSEE